MDSCLPNSCLPLPRSLIGHRRIGFRDWPFTPAAVLAHGGVSVKCEFGGSNAPLEPRSPTGRYLSGLLLDDRERFPAAARTELERLVAERDEAFARWQLSCGSDEASLHRRIVELKNLECQDAAEDAMYALILHEFSVIRVHMVPKLSKCICNGRLEIWPSKDWELESIHSPEVLEMVREHISVVTGWRANSSVTDSWATTQVQHSCLCQLYIASILFGYFLKSASLRHRLEWGLDLSDPASHSPLTVPEMSSLGSEYIAFGCISSQQSTQVAHGMQRRKNLRCYLMGFDQDTIQMCVRPKTKEAMSLVDRQSHALFGDRSCPGVWTEEESITLSFGSLRRLLLEGVAFGCFLWGAEEWLNGVYGLQENQV